MPLHFNVTLARLAGKIPKIRNPFTEWQQYRNLNIHEYLCYTLLKDAGIDVPKFGAAKTKEQAKEAAKKINTKDLVVKAQVLSGGRGAGSFKNGMKSGVHMVSTPDEAAEQAGKMLGQYLVTKQSGPAGLLCNTVLVAERRYPKHEYYMSIMMERAFAGPVIIASAEGGMNIEDVAAKNPKAIIYEPVDIIKGLQKSQAEKIAVGIGLSNEKAKVSDLLLKMYKLFIDKDILLLEINPLVQDKSDNFFALDAKFLFDENASFRQKAVFDMRDLTQEDPKEVAAKKFDLNYIALDGSVGCMVNGAGLAMGTMDLITVHGGKPANFLDVGGTATKETTQEAFKIITQDPNVKSILVNIFGGIIRCDMVAEGVIGAVKELNMAVPIVIRLQGTNMERAKDLILKSKMKILYKDDLDDAAKEAIKLAKK